MCGGFIEFHRNRPTISAREIYRPDSRQSIYPSMASANRRTCPRRKDVPLIGTPISYQNAQIRATKIFGGSNADGANDFPKNHPN